MQLPLQEWEEFRKPKMSLKDQVDKFKMLIYIGEAQLLLCMCTILVLL